MSEILDKPEVERLWINTALYFFLVASLLGLVLRIGFITGMPEWLKFRNILHAHSHVAMMGWLFSGIYIMIVKLFHLSGNRYKQIFWGIQISTLGMLLSFPIQGYGAVSISFTVLHLILSYAFIIYASKDIRAQDQGRGRQGVVLIMASFMFLFLSTLGTWALGPLMLSSWKGSAIYYAAVQFFLHFQFNGWFIFAALGLFVKVVTDSDIKIPGTPFDRFYRLLIISCILTYALAVSWSNPDNFIFWTNSLGVILQFIALGYFIRIIWIIRHELKEKLTKWVLFLWTFVLCCFIIKILSQTLVAIPELAKVSYTIHNFIIGFIHLIMLAMISVFLFGLIDFNELKKPFAIQASTGVILAGVILSEILLFGQGILLWAGIGFIPYYYLLIAIFSGLMPIGIILYLFARRNISA